MRMQHKIHSILIICSLVMATAGMDTLRMIAFYNLWSEKVELNEFVNFSSQDSDTEPMESEQNPFSQYSDIIEKEPQCLDEQYSWLKFKLASSVLVFFLHFSWQNIFPDSMYTPPEA
jgi:hypothetical protein